MDLKYLIILGLTACLLVNTVICKPAEDERDEEIEEDDGDEESEDSYVNDEENEEENETGPQPKITSSPVNLVVKEGDDVYLPCNVENIEHTVVMWKNGTTLLWTDDYQFKRDMRLKKFTNNTIHIHYAMISDAGVYTCQIATEPVQEVVHKLTVVGAPRIVELLPVEGKTHELHKGLSLTLVCRVEGYPQPTIVWRRKGHKHFPTGHEKIEGAAVTFEKVNRRHSGGYECIATNEYGTAEANLHISVLYAPEIEIEEETVTTALGYQPEITCTVHAEPKAQISWYKSGKPLVSNEHITINHIGNKVSLQINKVEESDFGSYTCLASNQFNATKKVVVLSGTPSKPKLRIDTSSDGKSPEVSWSVTSYSPILEYELKFKGKGDEEWRLKQPIVLNAEEGNIFKAREVLEGLSSSEHQAMVRAKNMYGWSAWSEPETFLGEAAAKSTSGVAVIRPMIVVTVATWCSIVCLLF